MGKIVKANTEGLKSLSRSIRRSRLEDLSREIHHDKYLI
jgi:hypothetical protein